MKERWCRLALLAMVLASGCDAAAPYRSVVQDQIRAYTEMERILASVTDAASMDGARAKLRDCEEKAEAIAGRFRDLGRPSPETQARLEPQLRQAQAALQKVVLEVGRIRTLPGGVDFLARFNRLGDP